MAKRRKLETPSSADLNRLEEEFRRETSPPSSMPGQVTGVAPIAQVVAETAAVAQPKTAQERARTAQLEASESRLQEAEASGLLMINVLTENIDSEAMVRDRTVLDADEMMELRSSISSNGQRLPIEIFEKSDVTGQSKRYGLISGYRRLMAVRELYGLSNDDQYLTVRAIVRPKSDADTAFVAMVEENEVRSELSQFERGRIAVISAQQGAFLNVEDAVNKLFATGSKAKRSKVRSFALIFEELGDMLEFPDALSEKRGLQLAQALRQGAEARIRAALATVSPITAAEEWLAIEAVIEALEPPAKDPKRGGRPRRTAPTSGWRNEDTMVTTSGVTIRKQADKGGFVLRFEGITLDHDLMDCLIKEIRTYLEKP
ncbi:MAG: ParB N-terminal domain-containing protein [Shimia sp.]|nr:ParB N-terminal domain-containing protein [Shimia sp.]